MGEGPPSFAPLTTYVMIKHGKKYRQAAQKVTAPNYSVPEAVKLLVETLTTKFDGTCEVHFNLNSDPKYADQIVRGTVVLPHGTGKTVRVVAFVPDHLVKEALEAGATVAGTEDLIAKVNSGWTDFDIAVAFPSEMASIAKVAKILGTKGLMPSPKAGTVTEKIATTIQELRAGKVEFKTDKSGIVHNVFGKVSFGPDKLQENLDVLIKAVMAARPKGIKGIYVKSISIATTMGPGLFLNLSGLSVN